MIEDEDVTHNNGEQIHPGEEKAAKASISLEYDRTVNYAMQQNDVPLIKELRIHNDDATVHKDLLIRLTAEPPFASPWERRITAINAGETFNLGLVDLPLSHQYLAGLTERVIGTLQVELLRDDVRIHTSSQRIEVLAYDEWNGLQSIPEILAAFVTPNHPAVESVLSDVAGILGSWTDSSALSGYQSRDPQRVFLTAAAIYTALQQRNISYITPPASFEETGQKIRLPDRILESRLATCLDLAVLTASCLEQAGIHPLIVLITGHAFAGFWLEDETFADVATDDLLRLRKRVELGQIALFETTLLTHQPAVAFAQAVQAATKHLETESRFRCVIDIHRARKSCIRPLPLRVELPSSTATAEVVIDPLAMPAFNLPAYALPSSTEAQAKAAETPATRLDRWKHKLLDLTLNNRQLNFRESKKNLPILCPDLGALEDALADGKSFKVFPRLDDLGETNARNADVHRSRTGKEAMDEMLREEFHARRLRADVTETEINRRLLEIYREAKLSIEENGANTLYLALGFLAWHETNSSPKRRLAPIILIPLEIERRSLQEGFSVKQGDDEPMVNVTLLAHLATDFELAIPGLDPIPMDEHGIDVALILRKFREAIVDIDRWEVLEMAYIGHFSFTKFLMWRDLEVRAKDLQKNAIVRHLIHTPSETYPDDGIFPDPDRLDDTHRPEETFCPLSADSSQLAAVHAAAAGKSFVLHGPPGTGKSQTITNIIAHNLALGRTVLFVSEKRAALEVVHRRLVESGLGPFCLELHSNKSHKKEVLSQLEQALDAQAGQASAEWMAGAERLATTRQELNAFVSALHAVRASGETVFHGIAQLIGHRDVPLLKFAWPAVAGIDRQQLQALRETVHQLQLAGTQVGHPATNAWAGAACEQWTPEFRNTVERTIDELRMSTLALGSSADGIIPIIFGGDQGPLGRQDLDNLTAIAAALMDSPQVPPTLLSAAEWDPLKATLMDIACHGRHRNDLREKQYKKFTPDLLGLDLEGLIRKWSVAAKSWIFPRWLGCRKVRQTLATVARPGYAPTNEEVLAELEQALALRQEERFMQEAAARAQEILGTYWQDDATDWQAVESYISCAESLRKVAIQVAGVDFERAIQLRRQWAQLLATGREQLSSAGPIGQRLQAYLDALATFNNAASALTSLLVLDPKTAWGPVATNDVLAAIRERINQWRPQLNGLRGWCHWQSLRRTAFDRNLRPLIDAYESQGLPAEKLPAAFTRGFYQWWCDAIISTEPALCGFFSAAFEDKIRRFKEIDDQYTMQTRKEIHARIAARLPRGQAQNPTSEMGLLRRQLQMQRAHLPVRSLIQKIPNLLPRLKPCLLMSPISVAQYLDPSHSLFDLVIFDEASQIPVWDAVGAIARGREAIIVGDPKQLPPTNFFSRADSGDGIDADDTLVDDLESILDDCIAAQLPQRHLNWHYRSRHESLIAFSNYHYYDNQLLTFPSPHHDLGISFRHVVGEYDKGKSRTNRAEASAVVNEVLGRLLDPRQAHFSIGIVTFSQAQQQLIDDLLEEARRQNPEIEPYFADGAAEPLFIKNLENVQGDERDVILFSICYGPDATGRVSMNFGPMNRDGGERRLNVAITRARQEVIVFSTLRAEQIDLSKTKSQGVGDLKCFLDYAERGPVAIAERRATEMAGECESPFEDQVCAALRAKGHTVHPQVGCSGYRVDLGIVDQERPGRYLLGIECDGANYHRAKTARDRDKLRESILIGLGWTIHRVWSTDWWERPAEELVRIETAIAAARQAALVPRPVTQPTARDIAATPLPSSAGLRTATAPGLPPSPRPTVSPEPALPVYDPFVMKELKGTPDDYYDARSDASIQGLIEAVVSKEGPVPLELVARRVAAHWAVGRVTSRAVTRIEGLAWQAKVKVVRGRETTIHWAPAQDPQTYPLFRIPGASEDSKRSAEHLPPQEVANAVLYVLEQHVSLPSAELVRETARLLGYQRTGTAVEKAMMTGIDLLLEKGAAKEEGGVIVHVG